MTHLHSHHRNHAVQQRTPAFPPWVHLTNAPVSPLDFGSTASFLRTPQNRVLRHHWWSMVKSSPALTPSPRIRDMTPMRRQHGNEPKRNLLRRAIDDPYWILMTLTGALGLAIIATVVYGAIQIILTVDAWLHTNAPTIGTESSL